MLDHGLCFGCVRICLQFYVWVSGPTVPSPGLPLDIPAWERRAELRVVWAGSQAG